MNFYHAGRTHTHTHKQTCGQYCIEPHLYWKHVIHTHTHTHTNATVIRQTQSRWNHQFLGAFAKLRKATISFVISVCLSVRPPVRMEQPDFDKICILAFYENTLRELKFNWNPTRTTGTLHENVFIFITKSRWILLRMINVSNNSRRENQNTHFVFSNFFFRKSCRLWGNVEKCGGAREAADDSMAARFMLDK